MSSSLRVDEVDGGGVPRRRGAGFRDAAWFDREYPRMVGVVRRVLDREHRSDASLAAAEDICVEAFSRTGRSRDGDDARSDRVLRRCLNGCMDVLVGHPGTVPVHPDLLGAEFDLGDRMPLAELHQALSSMGTTDRHVALLCHAAGYAPSEVAALLRRPLDDVLGRLARTATRLADARRLGLVPPAPGVDR